MSFVIFFTIIGWSCNHKNYDSDYNIINNDNYSVQSRNINLSDDGKSIFCEIGHLEGHFEIANADLSDNCIVKIHFEGNIKHGKAKLVLVNPNKSVKILKEIISTENKTCSEDLVVSCSSGINKIKFVGEDYSGDFRISQDGNKVFNYDGNDMFGGGFPFSSKN